MLTGLVYLLAGFFTGHFWRHLLPRRAELTRREFWHEVKEHARLRIRAATGGPHYGLLQKCAYASVVFLALPLIVVTGLTMSPSPEEEAGSLLDVDLDESLDRYVRERAALVRRLKQLSPDEWQKTAVHEAFDHYSVFIMFRHLLNHEMLHAYRIEQLMLKKDWD